MWERPVITFKSILSEFADMRSHFSPLERKVVEDVSSTLLMQHVHEISKYVRLSGSEDEARSLEYLKATLAGYDFKVEEYRFEAYVGYPEMAELQITFPESVKIGGVTAALAPSTPEAGTTAEIVYLGLGDEEAFSTLDARGKLVLVEGLAEPEIAKRADNHGAVGQIFINDEYAHEGIVSVVWGTPTHETRSLLPMTPCISITEKDGKHLRELTKKGKVTAKLLTKTWRGWKTIPVLCAHLRGRVERDKYVMLAGHIDSWHYGAMDNGSANAMMLEVARIMSKHRNRLRRGLRIVFWSGHSHGRYAGSAWYADTFWHDLEKNCVVHINADSLGSKGATCLTEAEIMPETREFASAFVKRVANQELSGRRFSRAGDQSFWGIGIPSIFMALSEIPVGAGEENADLKTVALFGPSPSGAGWWWHTPEDTVDKIDAENLNRDTRIYALITHALCTDLTLPFNYQRTAEDIERNLKELQHISNGIFDLQPLIDRTDRLIHALSKLNRIARRAKNRRQADVINTALMRLGRALIPITHTSGNRYEHDLAVPIPPLPSLDRIRQLVKLSKESDEFKFMSHGLRRNSNMLADALDRALEIVDRALRAGN